MKKSTLLSLALAAAGALGCNAQADGEMAAYLFAYFTGNSPQQEQICYAISYDGFNYTPLNGGKPVIASDSIALTGCVRDPHILRGEDGKFYMVATDMKSSLGWQSNHGLVLMRSDDMISWEHHAIDFQKKYAGTYLADAKYVWAPQTIYDEEAGKYMIYFAFGDNNVCKYQTPYWVYANEDFTDLEGQPQVMFDRGAAAIDMDIVLDDDGIYHCFYKDEATTHGITQCTFAKSDLHDSSKWDFNYGKLSYNEAAEGSGVFRLNDGDWCLMWDCYNNGYYTFTRSHDLKTFTKVQDTKTRGAFTPRHGTVMAITQAELDVLQAAFPCATTKAEVPDGDAYLIQSESYMCLGANDANSAVVVDPAKAAPLRLLPSSKFSGYYNVTIEKEGVTLYLGQYAADGWTLTFAADGADTEPALWGIEDVGNGMVRLRNAKTASFLGSDNITDGSNVYGNKNGNVAWHKWLISTAATEYTSIFENMLGQAADLLEENMSAKAKADLEAACVDIEDFKAMDAAAQKAALSALASALAAANTSAANYASYAPTLEKMIELTESTNVYTQEALNKYLQPVADYENGTLQGTLINPWLVTGWHASVDCDALLMSAWEGNTQDWGGLHVNTWSVEGEADGTDFTVPFMEYWVGDADRLGARTLTATLTGLKPSEEVKVDAWVRVRATNNTGAPQGITLAITGSEPIDVTVGEKVQAFNLGVFSIEGTTDENGTLVIKYDVASGNNVSWLSWRDMKWSYANPDGISDIKAPAFDADAPIYDLQGRRVENSAPGLYIQSGRKFLVK